jgi:hypothetical protein
MQKDTEAFHEIKSFFKPNTYIGFEVFTAVVMKSIVFWDMTPCSPLSCNRRFGGTYRLHLQGRRIISARTSRQAGSKQNNLPAGRPVL